MPRKNKAAANVAAEQLNEAMEESGEVYQKDLGRHIERMDNGTGAELWLGLPTVPPGQRGSMAEKFNTKFFEVLIPSCQSLEEALVATGTVPISGIGEINALKVMIDVSVGMHARAADVAAGGDPFSPRNTFGLALMDTLIQIITTPYSAKAVATAAGEVFNGAISAAHAVRSTMCGLRTAMLACFVKLGRDSAAALKAKKAKGLAAAHKTSMLENVEQAVSVAEAFLRPAMDRFAKGLAIVARVSTQHSDALSDEFGAAVADVTATYKGVGCLDAFLDNALEVLGLYLRIYNQHTRGHVEWAKEWDFLGPCHFTALDSTFQDILLQTIAVRESTWRMLEQAQACGAIEEKGDGFNAASLRKQLSAVGKLLGEDFAPPKLVQKGCSGDHHSQYMEALVDHLQAQGEKMQRELAEIKRTMATTLASHTAKLDAVLAAVGQGAENSSSPQPSLPRRQTRTAAAAAQAVSQQLQAPLPTPSAAEQPVAASIIDLAMQFGKTFRF